MGSGSCFVTGRRSRGKERRMKRWVAIGDSFTYLNDHCEETGGRLHKGYVTRTLEQLAGCEVELINIGFNGSTFDNWRAICVPKADVYTVLLGTNDWKQNYPLGTESDFSNSVRGSILGNCGILLRHIREVSPMAPILVMTPVERGEFVYVGDYTNNFHDSSVPENGLMLADVAKAIRFCCERSGVTVIDLHEKSGFTPENAVKFKRVVTPDGLKDLPWPDYTCFRFDPEKHPYPYPVECQGMTYDGLHPSDEGAQIIADLLAPELRKALA